MIEVYIRMVPSTPKLDREGERPGYLTTVRITNDESGTKEVGNYDVVAVDWHDKEVFRGRIEGYERLKGTSVQLAALALEAMVKCGTLGAERRKDG